VTVPCFLKICFIKIKIKELWGKRLKELIAKVMERVVVAVMSFTEMFLFF
jgi:hypothetical protein